MGELRAQLEELDTHYSLLSFLKDIMKMADIDIDPFSNHNKMDTQPNEPMGETIPLTLEGGAIGGGSTWEPEQETSLRRMSIRKKVLREHVEVLYQKLSDSHALKPRSIPF